MNCATLVAACDSVRARARSHVMHTRVTIPKVLEMDGLTAFEAEERLKSCGRNEIVEPEQWIVLQFLKGVQLLAWAAPPSDFLS